MSGVVDYRIEILGQPFSKARPRVTSRGTYTPAKQRKNAEKLTAHFREAVDAPLTCSVEVDMTFYRQGKQRIDLDNMVKQVLDAANGVVFVDDVQVVKLSARIELDRENPRTLVVVRDFETSMPRGSANLLRATCQQCEGEIIWKAYDSKSEAPVYCSRTCFGLARRLPEGACPECSTVFRPASKDQRYCSVQCARSCQSVRQLVSATKQRNAAEPNRCRECSTPLARKTAVMCRECWLTIPDKKTRRSEILRGESEAA